MATTYISGAGSDSNDGLTELTPKLTLASGTPIANNDVIRIRRGTSVALTASKFPTGNLTVEAYGPESDGLAELLIPAGTYQFTHTGTAGTTYTVRGLRATNTGAVGSGQGFAATQGATLILEEFAVDSPFQNGVRCGYGAGHRVKNGRVSQVRNNGVYVGTTGQTTPSGGIYEYLTIDASLCANDGFSLHDGTPGGSGNIIRHCNITGGVEECVDIQPAYASTLIADCNLRASSAQVNTWSVILMKGSGRIVRSRLTGGVAAALKIDSADGVVVEALMIVCGASEANAQGVICTSAANIDLRNLTMIGNAESSRSMLRMVSTTGWTLKNSLFLQAVGDANPIITTSTADPVSGAVDGNYYRLGGDGSNAFDSDTFAVWKAAYNVDASSVSSAADPGVSGFGVPTIESALLSGGIDLGHARDIRGNKGRSYIGAYSAPLSRGASASRPSASARSLASERS